MLAGLKKAKNIECSLAASRSLSPTRPGCLPAPIYLGKKWHLEDNPSFEFFCVAKEIFVKRDLMIVLLKPRV